MHALQKLENSLSGLPLHLRRTVAPPVTEKQFMAREEDFVINFGYAAQHPHAYLPAVAWLSHHSLCCYSAGSPGANAMCSKILY